MPDSLGEPRSESSPGRRRFGPTRIAATIGLASLLIVAAGTGAEATHSTSPSASELSEQELRAFEIEALGPEHASEHAAARHATRIAQKGAPGRKSDLAHSLTTGSAPPSEVGEWTQAPFELPNYAIHAALLPTGKVLFWGYPPLGEEGRPSEGEAALWNPAAGTGEDSLEEVPPPMLDVDGDGDTEPVPIYCSGQSPLPNGTVLVTGGNLVWPQNDPDDEFTGFAGLDSALTFNPWTEQWIQQPSMTVGRWYPTQTLLGDGRTLIVGGFTGEPPGDRLTDIIELFTPPTDPNGVGTMTTLPSDPRGRTLYPHMFTLPSGWVLMAGPGPADRGMMSPTDFTWQKGVGAPRPRGGGTAVLKPYDPWTVLAMGGYAPAGPDNIGAPQAEVDRLDLLESANWQSAPPLNVPRSYHNTVLLPDGSMVTVGGGNGFDGNGDGNWATDPTTPQRQVELYDPLTEEWRLGPAQQEDRTYHSVALLLPDGRVWSAGDDVHPRESDGSLSRTDSGEIYSPPYLFQGQRPVINSVRSSIGYNQRFVIDTAKRVKKAVLIAPGAPTHSNDMHQRLVRLTREGRTSSGDLKVVAPSRRGAAPPGYYMLFAVHKGVPSVARWVLLR